MSMTSLPKLKTGVPFSSPALESPGQAASLARSRPGKFPKTPDDLPEVSWSIGDFAKLIQLKFPVPIEALNTCAEVPDQWIPLNKIFDRTGVEPPSGRGQLAEFGFSVRTTFGRCNQPWEAQWRAGGKNCNYYRIDQATADDWHSALEAASETEAEATSEIT
jgi:hypothetical protein